MPLPPGRRRLRSGRAKPFKRPILKTPSGYRPRPGIMVYDKKGRLLPWNKLYSSKVKLVKVFRGTKYHTFFEPTKKMPTLTPKWAAEFLTPDEFDRLPEFTKPIKDYSSKKKYQAWDVAGQIDKTRGLRRKLLKITMTVKTGGGQFRKISTYTKIKASQKRSYQVFAAMNQAIGAAGFFLYNRVGGKLLAERVGRKVKLMKVLVEEII